MGNRFRLAVFLAMASLTLAAAAQADEPGANPPVPTAEPSVVDVVIGEVEQRILRDYYQRRLDDWEKTEGGGKAKKNKNKHHAKDLPPGLAKRGELPPGLRKQLVKNGHLPPGLEGRDLPNDLLSSLPPLDPAYRYAIADDRVLLIKRATNVILDVLAVAAADVAD